MQSHLNLQYLQLALVSHLSTPSPFLPQSQIDSSFQRVWPHIESAAYWTFLTALQILLGLSILALSPCAAALDKEMHNAKAS